MSETSLAGSRLHQHRQRSAYFASTSVPLACLHMYWAMGKSALLSLRSVLYAL
jgi:hypothetical protein